MGEEEDAKARSTYRRGQPCAHKRGLLNRRSLTEGERNYIYKSESIANQFVRVIEAYRVSFLGGEAVRFSENQAENRQESSALGLNQFMMISTRNIVFEVFRVPVVPTIPVWVIRLGIFSDNYGNYAVAIRAPRIELCIHHEFKEEQQDTA
jgi:hypothetical protein